MAKLPDRNTVDTLVNVMNNGTAGGFVVGNVSSLYQKGENDSQQVTRTEALATTQSLLNLGLTLMNTGMSAISNAQNTGSLSHLTPQATSAISATSTALGKANVAVATLGATIDLYKIGNSAIDPNSEVSLSDSLSLLSNVAAIAATGAAMAGGAVIAGVSAPVLAVGAAIVALAAAGASIYVSNTDPDQSLMDALNYLAVDGLGDLGDSVSDIILDIFDPDRGEFKIPVTQPQDYHQPHEFTPWDMDGDGIPDAIDKDPFTSYLDPNSDWPQWAKDLANKTYRIAYYDPLAIDMDGDGVISTLAEANSAGALFDHDGDGIRTATGWIAKQDGIIVRDINGNGIIENGKELFGDNTILKNGQRATSGLQALADLDDNADGIIDNNDAVFSELKIWQDENGDGISTADELVSLTTAGITSINVKDKQTVNQSVAGGTIKEQTTFTKADGTTSKVADINFTNDGIYSQYIEKVAVSEAIAKLPELKGFGRLADLHQAAMKSPELATALESYSHLTTRAEQKVALDNIMTLWAKTDPMYIDNQVEIVNMYTQEWEYDPNSTNIVWLRPGESAPIYYNADYKRPVNYADDATENKLKFAEAALAFNPSNIYYQRGNDDNVTPMLQMYDKTKDALFHSLLSQTILKPYLDSLKVITNGDRFAEINKLFDTNYKNNSIAALEDLKDLLILHGKSLDAIGWDKGFVLLQQWRAELSATSPEDKAKIDEIFKEVDGIAKTNSVTIVNNETQTSFSATSGDDKVIINTQAGQTVYGGNGDDIIVSGKGNDKLQGGTGFNSYIFFKGAGKDTVIYDNTGVGFDKLAFVDIKSSDAIYYQKGNDLVIRYGSDEVTLTGALGTNSSKHILLNFSDKTVFLTQILMQPLQNIQLEDNSVINGWRGADFITGDAKANKIYAKEGNDTIKAGAGNDYIDGGTGNNTYLFKLGDGQDTISYDNTGKDTDTIILEGIQSTAITLTKNQNNLMIGYGDGDSISLVGALDSTAIKAIKIKFADRETTLADLLTQQLNNTLITDSAAPIEGWRGADLITGDDQANKIYAQAGNDTINARGGNDYIDGGTGNNTYLFKVGDGNDVISYDNMGTDIDTLVLEGIQSTDIVLTKNQNNLIINYGNTNSITLIGALDTSSTKVVNVKFADAEISLSQLLQRPIESDTTTGNSDYIYGWRGADHMVGDEKTNAIYGYDGDDYLEGKTGNDSLNGGTGNNTYLFKSGDGQDTISYDNTGKDTDTIILEGIQSTAITLTKNQNNLMIGYGDGDSISLVGALDSSATKAIKVKFADSETTLADLLTRPLNNIAITDSTTLIEGWRGADFITGDDKANTIYAQAGNDTINAKGGNDYIDGGIGNNTYLFKAGDGNDVISYDYLNNTELDTFMLQGIDSKSMTIYKQNDNLVIKYSDSDSITLTNALLIDAQKQINIQFSDKTLQLKDLLNTPLNNIDSTLSVIEGWRHDDNLTGNETNNQLFGLTGNDSLTGNKGNDKLIGGTGIDTYHFSRGDGIDEILEDSYATEANHIVFKDINPADIQKVSFEGNDLVVQYSQDDKIILKNYIANSQNSTLTVQFADGTTWHNNELMAKVTFEGSNETDTITGTLNDSPNIINAHAGNDTVHGNKIAQNIIDGGAGADELHGGDNIDIIKGGIGEDFIYGEAGNDHIDGGEDHDTLFGGDGDDTIIGGNGNDWLQGDAGKDTLLGGLGDDTYDVDDFDTIIEKPNEGYDAIFIANDFDLAGTNLEEIHLKGNGNFKAIGDAGDNGLYGNEGNNYLDGKAGSDIMAGGAGDDYYVVDKYETLVKNPDGTTTYIRGDQVAEGNLIGNYVQGDSGGNDTVEQWDDHRFYSQDATGNWADTGSYHLLQNNIENLILKGQAKTAFGNELDNTITLNSQNNFVNALGGNDTIIYQKGGGQDTIVSTDSTTAQDALVIQGYDLSNAIFTRLDNTASDHDMLQIRFAGSKDTITLLDYYAPATTQNNNTIDNKIDHIVFQNNGKETTLTQAQVDAATVSQHDNHAPTINAQIPVIKVSQTANLNYQFASNVIVDQDAWDKTLSYKITSMNQDANGKYQPIPEWLHFDTATQTLTGTPPSNFTGSLSFWYWGTDLFGNGTATSFTLTVTPPNQAPTVANAISDQTANYGTAFSYNMPTTTFKDPEGDALSYTATLEDGSALPSWLVFNPTTRTFSGTAPQTSSPINVKVTATDTFKNSVSDVFTINFAAPNLTINGTSNADTLTGKEGNDTLNGLAGNDTLIGGAGNDKLDGGTGADKMTGGTGNDTYIVDNTGDIVIENANEGIDTVLSSITYTLGNNVENFTLTGTTAINGTGNALDNILIGNTAINTLTGGAGNDTLDGGAGADKLIGGTGNDTYVVDNTGDVITENANGGTDTVQSSITYTLGANLENLTLTGTTTINGTGNALKNTLMGNNAANILSGGAGDDILDGGLGNDTLIGGAGNDTYIYRANQGVDSIDNAGGGTDSINFADINDSQLSYHKDSNDLVILVDKDLGQQVRVKNYFVTTADNAIDIITTKNGVKITAAMIATNLTVLPGKPDMSGDNILKDTLGNDTLAGEAGNDTYYHTGGKDVIIDTAGVDKLIFGNGITYNQVGSGLLQSGNDLILRVDGSTTNEVTLTNFFKDANSIIETISFETGGSITAQEIYSLFGKTMPQPTTPVVTAPAIQGDANNNDLVGKSTDDTLQGLAGNDRLQGLAGNDKLEGGAGNDILVGGSGNDILTGGTGNDLYYFKVGFGQDTIVNTGGGVDNIYFDGLTFNQLSQGLMKSGNDLTLKVSGSTDQLTLKDFFLGGDNAGVNINFASGGSLTSDQIFGAYGLTNPNPSANTASEYQSSLSTMLNLMSDYNKLSPLTNESTVL
ncbi:putative Ig domain-containing protein [Moraxella osloensis]|uniref:Dystroglycan-type cadherin-like domain-containing protein n=1 Tax=Faucicola osloensis TaxID=34062 RepID=A0A2D2LXU5_FAUOS|nr:putative Ig domain-containing protein [Moraxella osloensis]ATR79842.1 hypothetical protein NP7_10795 [Moraxella osloensis]